MIEDELSNIFKFTKSFSDSVSLKEVSDYKLNYDNDKTYIDNFENHICDNITKAIQFYTSLNRKLVKGMNKEDDYRKQMVIYRKRDEQGHILKTFMVSESKGFSFRSKYAHYIDRLQFSDIHDIVEDKQLLAALLVWVKKKDMIVALEKISQLIKDTSLNNTFDRDETRFVIPLTQKEKELLSADYSNFNLENVSIDFKGEMVYLTNINDRTHEYVEIKNVLGLMIFNNHKEEIIDFCKTTYDKLKARRDYLKDKEYSINENIAKWAILKDI
jgi:hypothetical protein